MHYEQVYCIRLWTSTYLTRATQGREGLILIRVQSTPTIWPPPSVYSTSSSACARAPRVRMLWTNTPMMCCKSDEVKGHHGLWLASRLREGQAL